MEIHILGHRYGGNSHCALVKSRQDVLVLDAGSDILAAGGLLEGSLEEGVYEAERQQIQDWKDLVNHVNSRGFLPEEDLEKLQEIRGVMYTTWVERKHPCSPSRTFAISASAPAP